MPHWRGQEADLKLERGDLELSIGALQDIEVSIPKEIEELRASGSIKRLDLMQHEGELSISAELMEFDQGAFEELTDYDSSASEINDASDVATFTIGGGFVASDGSKMDLEIKEVYFDEMEISGSRDDYIGMPLDGSGDELKIHATNYLESPDVTESASTDGTIEVYANTIMSSSVEGETIEVDDDGGLDGITVGDTDITDSEGLATFIFNESSTGTYDVIFSAEDETITTTCTVTIE